MYVYPQGCEQEVLEAQKDASDEFKNECLVRLSWALVHSRRPEDMHRGIAMLECMVRYKTLTINFNEKSDSSSNLLYQNLITADPALISNHKKSYYGSNCCRCSFIVLWKYSYKDLQFCSFFRQPHQPSEIKREALSSSCWVLQKW